MSLGQTLRYARKQLHLSQNQVSTGICAQSMLSAIENDHYTPNARLLASLCNRLKINLNTLSLATDFAISEQTEINQTIQRLCNQHRYTELKVFLQDAQTLAQITTSEQTQAYYYYLGVAQLQADHDWAAAERNFQFSVNIASGQVPSVLTRLGLSSLALIFAHQGAIQKSHEFIKHSLLNIDQMPYDDNLNIPFYLAALIQYQLKNYASATHLIMTTISFATRHRSPYMLANDYRLLAEIEIRQGLVHKQLDALEKQRFLSSLFHEPVNENF